MEVGRKVLAREQRVYQCNVCHTLIKEKLELSDTCTSNSCIEKLLANSFLDLSTMVRRHIRQHCNCPKDIQRQQEIVYDGDRRLRKTCLYCGQVAFDQQTIQYVDKRNKYERKKEEKRKDGLEGGAEEKQQKEETVRKKAQISAHASIVAGTSEQKIDRDPDLELPSKHKPIVKRKSDESEFYDCRFLKRYFAKKKELELRALYCRKLWRKKELVVARHIDDMITGVAGPDWFQDLSHQQMELIDGLPAALEQDKKKGIVGGSQKLLFNFGVFPLIKSKILKKCIDESDGEPIKFLYLLHAEIAYLETEDYEREYFKAKRVGRRISPYSLNERLLFSAVFHVHFQTLLQKLDDILPPSVKPPKVLWAKKPRKVKCKLHRSPYMQPQPINEKCWYEERAEADLEKKIMKKIAAREQADKRERIKRELDQKEKDRKFQEQTDEMIMRAHSYEMKTMMNPRARSVESIQSDERPQREDKLQIIERMYPPSIAEEAEEGEVVEVTPKTGIKRLDKLLANQTHSHAVTTRYITRIQAIEEKRQFYESKYNEIANRTPESTLYSKTPTESQIDEDDIEDEDSSFLSEPDLQASDSDLERSEDISGVIESIAQEEQEEEEEEENGKTEESVSEVKTAEDNCGGSENIKKNKKKKVIEEEEKSGDDEKYPRMKIGKLMDPWLDLMDIVAKPCKRICDEIAGDKEEGGQSNIPEEEEEEPDEVDIFHEQKDNRSIVSDIIADLTNKGLVERVPEGANVEGASEDYSTVDEEELAEHVLDEERLKQIFTFEYVARDEEAEHEEHTSYEEELIDEENDPSSPEEYSSETLKKLIDSCIEEEQRPPKLQCIGKQMTVKKKKEKKLIKLKDLVDMDDDASTRGGKSQSMEDQDEEEEEEEEETEGAEEAEEEAEELIKKETEYKYVMDIHADQQLTWFEKLRISKETITGKILSVDTSPQIPAVKAYPDVPDEELFQELYDDIADESYFNYTTTRAVQTEPTELLCNLKEVIRVFKVRKPVEKIRESIFDNELDQEDDQAVELPTEGGGGEEEISNEEEGETEDTESVLVDMVDNGSLFSPADNLQTFVPIESVAANGNCHYITNGFKDFELNIDADTGEVVKELNPEELEQLNVEREMELEELRYGTPIYWFIDENLKRSKSEIFQADKVIIETERFRIKASLPPPFEEDTAVLSDHEDHACKFSHKPLNVECTEQECGLIDDDELPMNEYVLARKMLSKIPADERLEAAIKYLGDRGDPLAILPDIHHVPWLTRWYELRRGIRTKLTPEDKAHLMSVSIKLWENTGDRCDSIVAKTIDKTDLTWDNIEWVRKTSRRLLEKYHYGVKSTLVTNSRNYFPTMFCEYFNNPYMKRFRDAFFTYLPGRPNDAYTFRPWAKKESKDNECNDQC